ncbi:unnamed protein product [Paramecium pentaurelia]|uniref:G-protein coupled receptors family 1 profile domain-containing protein n=1 Tax=Paramecium pentaurelia TaxID=43138 RepID=A0A8S1TRY4_9CILI|nr:unnamed protein product [Paramecium pentaurelia]
MLILFYVCISLSIGGSTLMLTHLFFFDNLKVFAQRIVACLSISDCFYAFGLLLYVEPSFDGYDITRCTIQGAVTQFARICAFLWSTSISYFLYVSITRGQKQLIYFQRYEKFILIIGFAIPCLMATIPLFFQSYAPTPAKVPAICSINSNDENKSIEKNRSLSLYLNLTLFYIPLLLSLIISVYFILRSYFKIKRIKSQYELLNKQINIQLMFARNLILYPLALFICWLPSQIIFLIFVFKNTWIEQIQQDYFINQTGTYYYIRIIQYGASFLQGFFNSLVYWFNSYQMRKRLNILERANLEYQKTKTFLSNNNEYNENRSSSQLSNSFENLQEI